MAKKTKKTSPDETILVFTSDADVVTRGVGPEAQELDLDILAKNVISG